MKGELLTGNIKILEEVLYDQFSKRNDTIALKIDDLEQIDDRAAQKLQEYKLDADLRKKSLLILCDNPARQRTLRENGTDRLLRLITSRDLDEEYSPKKKFSIPGLNLQLNVKL
jgi:hypothetical protein